MLDRTNITYCKSIILDVIIFSERAVVLKKITIQYPVF